MSSLLLAQAHPMMMNHLTSYILLLVALLFFFTVCEKDLIVWLLTPRSTNYGTSFTQIDSHLDPNNPNPVLWWNFYVSPINKNMVCSPCWYVVDCVCIHEGTHNRHGGVIIVFAWKKNAHGLNQKGSYPWFYQVYLSQDMYLTSHYQACT